MRIPVIMLLAALALASASGSADAAGDFRLVAVGQSGVTVTLAWKRQPGAVGYQFSRNGKIVAKSMDASTTRVTFWKGRRYGVQVLGRVDGRVVKGDLATLAAASPRVVPRKQAHPLVLVPARRPEFKLRKASETRTTVRFTWRGQPGVDGYRFVRDGKVVSTTFDESLTSATFWKGKRYAIDALRVTPNKRIRYAERTIALTVVQRGSRRLVFRSSPRVQFRLRVVSQTPKTITFRWKRQPGIDGYRFARNGRFVSQTFKRSTTEATFWKGSRYVVEALHVTADKKAVPVMRALAYRAGTSRSGGKEASPSAPIGGAGAPPGTAAPGPPLGSPAGSPPATGGSSAPATPSTPGKTTPPPSPSTPPSSPSSPPSVGPGGTVTLSGSYTPAAFLAAVALGPAGAVTITGGFTVTGDVDLTRARLRVERATIQGSITFEPSSTGSAFVNSSALSFNIAGADDIHIEGSTFDGQCRVAQNWIQPSGGDGARGFVVRGNTLRNYHVCADESLHSEAIFVAARSQDGLIEGNTFTDNGTTGHLFFSWFGGDPGSDYPRDICVRGNTFTRSLNRYYHIQFRQEIPSSANIDIDPSNVLGPSTDGYPTSLTSAFERPCG